MENGSDYAQGATILIESPIPALERGQLGGESPRPQARTGAKVLIADDETDLQMSIGRRLVHAGYEVLIAADGAEATQMAIQAKPDVIVLDIGMPCGDGHTVAERLRTNPKTMFIPVVFLTARTSPADRQRAYEHGAYAYITKPFKPEELLDTLKRALDRDS
jgi:CheY-like chemotaxis protein